MEDGKSEAKGDAGSSGDVPGAAGLLSVTGSVDTDLARLLLRQAVCSFIDAGGETKEQRQRTAVKAAIGALKGLAPSDELEGMLAVQMIATHNAALDCLQQANGISLERCDHYLKHAAKLLGIYARQMEALDKHRGKGQDKITVEHVTVNEGGQAIVGNVAAGAGGPSAAGGAASGADRPTLTDNPAPLAPQIDAANPTKRKQEAPAQ